MSNIVKKIFVSGRYTKDQEKHFEGLLVRSMREVEVGIIDPGLWAKAKSSSEYDNQKSKALYIKLRAEFMWDNSCTWRDTKKGIKAIFKGKDIIDVDNENFEIGDWTGSISLKNNMPIGEGFIVDIYGNRSVGRQSYNYYWLILSKHPYKLPDVLFSKRSKKKQST